ncbi:unnamed protein product [Arctogadus glacialis]
MRSQVKRSPRKPQDLHVHKPICLHNLGKKIPDKRDISMKLATCSAGKTSGDAIHLCGCPHRSSRQEKTSCKQFRRVPDYGPAQTKGRPTGLNIKIKR